ncbi:MAG: P-type conjugative transfer protein TrbJ [Sphingomonadaceae bacterium]|jgi:P-type conjugative transfer protein TrbJ
MNRKHFIALAVAASFTAVAPSTQAGSVAGFGGATEITQLANNVELVNLYLQQVQSYATQLQQYQNMLQNTLNIPAQVWGAIQADLMGVANVVRQGQALAYSAQNIGTQFQNTFKGFSYPQGFNFKTEYRNWSRATLDGIKGAFEAAKMQADQFATEEGVLIGLRSQSQSAQGQMQALQVGAQIAEQQVQQLQKLRQLMMVQMQAQNSYLAAQEQKDAASRLALDDFFRFSDPRQGSTNFRGGSR